MAMIDHYKVEISESNYSIEMIELMIEYCMKRFGIDWEAWGGWIYSNGVLVFRFYTESDRTEFKLSCMYETGKEYDE